jgi:hypothetical protein
VLDVGQIGDRVVRHGHASEMKLRPVRGIALQD